MRCKKEEFIKNGYYHLYNHAIDEQNLFYEDADYDLFLKKFNLNLERIPASVFAYCLMPNHFHFLLRQDSDKKIYSLINYVLISYVQCFNRKYDRKGRLFRSPLHHKLVGNALYLINLCKYIHLNPVSAGLVDKPEEWEYSNYAEWVGVRQYSRIPCEIRQVYFPNPSDYRSFVESPIADIPCDINYPGLLI
jgi:putative transposase